ncbi:hypothetical protein SELR_05830 [Selenomonas ruminantium subsp. lactilytica TAM6421]|uniref:Membrane protein involved in the export of O-antigen and teichoic acid n=1 Tax=Selenomonas ruminantium subsp. lactilytica (strain NBRC 103574 / TAM6421) TaxID=927704 RepID=I0GNF4_SELRL|nr:hypothetical protein [Selenomonas ruminantium]BAL82291.1 hypothetical protein SELR_05830 [Selenomonas ruminantium subsp. lactilytica TAM6421]
MSNKSVVSNTIILGALAIFLSSAINLIMVPFITQRLGVEAYGFVTLGRNIADYAGIAMLALNSFSARFMAVSYMQDKQKDFSEYYSTVFLSNLVIGAILFIIGAVISIFANEILNIPDKFAIDVPILFLGIFLSSYLMFASTAFQSITYAIKRLDLYNLIRNIGLLTQAFILVALFFCFEGKIWYVGLAYLGQNIIIFILCYLVKQRYVSELRARLETFSFSRLRILVLNGIWNSINQIGNVLNSGLDLVVTNVFLTGEIMGIISITKMIGGLFSTINQTISQSFHPVFLQLFSDGKQDELLKEFKRATNICGIFANTVFVTLIVFGRDFYRIWVPSVSNETLYYLTILAIIPSLFEGYISPIGYIYTLKMKNKVPCFVTIAGGLVNVVGMLVLLTTTSLAEYAVLGTTMVVMTIIYFIFNPIYMAKCLQIRFTYFYPAIMQNFALAVISCVLMLFCKEFLPEINGWLLFIVYNSSLAIILILFQSIVLLGKNKTLSYIKKWGGV